ncbi:hypothetical protein K437DRAFT_229024 [Tilletiaria anomala UBC 951]|uniref:AN1-type domain-containing protein n=1 Tax=Tilletiaria anomala (strain ATCC 24038 / CBS 436.72 / UBC 951) TaxID=1037660 RepID=A0A066V7N5_TILAU|nr:uncharacterized protein K437DRAFT_229024 [Tilletiaria anomala UBC 951]KDN37742.1 hypothetical protein K437DRAFT_229024 [Tilletiaria anomala UBC 951]
MEYGTNCSLGTCSRLSFLPINCTYCKATFCEDHHFPDRHTCAAPSTLASRERNAAASPRKACEAKGCDAFTLEVDTSSRTSVGGFTHAAPRCERCRGSFCMAHRSFGSHDCKAPVILTEGQKKILAAEERKRKAQEILKKNFPGRGAAAKPKR